MAKRSAPEVNARREIFLRNRGDIIKSKYNNAP